LQTRDIELIKSSITNGRIYFPSTDIKFFPADSLADRKGDGHKGKPVLFRAGGEEFETDIRISSGQRISPRSSFGRYLKAVAAQPGDRVRVTRTSEREYSVDYLGR
jgi:hypothetical protein